MKQHYYRKLYELGVVGVLLLGGVLLVVLIVLGVMAMSVMKQWQAATIGQPLHPMQQEQPLPQPDPTEPESLEPDSSTFYLSGEDEPGTDNTGTDNTGTADPDATSLDATDPDMEPAADSHPESADLPDAAAADAAPADAAVAPAARPSATRPRKTLRYTGRPSQVLTHPGMTLRSLARRYYGNEVFWVCIYDYNIHTLSDPEVLPSGIRLRMPPSDYYGIDASNPASVCRAKAIEREMLNN